MASASRKEPGPSGKGDLLESFLQGFEAFVGEVSELASEATPKGDHRLMARSARDSLVGQTTLLAAFVRENAAGLSAPQRAELDRFLKVQNGAAMAKDGVAVARQLFQRSPTAGILQWTAQLLKELKKIKREILETILGLLNLPWLKWIDTIFLLIDQGLDLLLSILADAFDLDFVKTSRQLGAQEISHQLQLSALMSLKAASARMPAPDPL